MATNSKNIASLVEDDKLASQQAMPDNYVDVSGLFFNCFFHCLALHYLTNNIPLPKELETVHVKTDNYLYKELKRHLDLDLLRKAVAEKNKDSSQLVELSTALAFLFRSLYVHKLSNNEAMKKYLFKEDENSSFLTLVAAKRYELSQLKEIDDKISTLRQNPLCSQFSSIIDYIFIDKNYAEYSNFKNLFLSTDEFRNFKNYIASMQLIAESENNFVDENSPYPNFQNFIKEVQENKYKAGQIPELCEKYWLEINSFNKLQIDAQKLAELEQQKNDVIYNFEQAVIDSPFYNRNKRFFDSLSSEPFEGEEEVFKEDWDETVFPAYCRDLLETTPMLISELPFFLQELGLSYIIKSSNGKDLYPGKKEDSPLLTIKLSGKMGHYFLLKTEATKDSLAKYEAELKIYKDEQTEIMEQRAVITDKSPLLMDIFAIKEDEYFNDGLIIRGNNPLDTLVDFLKVLELKDEESETLSTSSEDLEGTFPKEEDNTQSGDFIPDVIIPAVVQEEDPGKSKPTSSPLISPPSIPNFLNDVIDKLYKLAQANLDEQKAKTLQDRAFAYQNLIRQRIIDKNLRQNIDEDTKTYLADSKAIIGPKIIHSSKATKVVLAIAAVVVVTAIVLALSIVTGGFAGGWALGIAAFILALHAAKIAAIAVVVASGIVGLAAGGITASKLGMFNNSTEEVVKKTTEVADEAKQKLLSSNL